MFDNFTYYDLISLIGILLVCVGVAFYLVLNATTGYQDETGFHYGKPPSKE